MTREQAEKEIRDNFTKVWADGIIKALEQEPRKGHLVRTRENKTMTNGEKILNAFPNATTRIYKFKGFTYIVVEQDDKWIADFDMEWWNTEYKE